MFFINQNQNQEIQHFCKVKLFFFSSGQFYSPFTDILDIVHRKWYTEGFVKIYRARVNIMGHSRAGKTSLLRRLLGQPFEENIRSTEGIAIHVIKSEFYMKGKKTKRWSEKLSVLDEIRKDIYRNIQTQYFTAPNTSLKGSQISTPDVLLPSQEPNVKMASSSESITLVPHVFHKNSHELPTNYKGLELSDRMRHNILTSNLRSQYLLYAWDFGGQEEFIATHHFFLDINCTILIVMDITRNLHKPVKDESSESVKRGIPQTPAQYLCHWLGMIHTKALEERVEPNVALVLTHKDLIQSYNVEQYIQNYIDELAKVTEGKAYQGYISQHNIFVADNKTKIGGELTSLRHKIFTKFSTTKSWGQEISVRWLKCEADLLDKSKGNLAPYLTISAARESALAYGMDNEDVDSFLEFHHSLGSLIHYDDPALQHIIIREPQWLVNQFKALVTANEFLEERHLQSEITQDLKKGIVTKMALSVLWKGNDVEFLTALMIKFNLMLLLHSSHTDSDTYIIPCMLPDYKPNKYAKETFMTMDLVYNSLHKQRNTDAIPVGTYQKLVCRSARRKNWQLRHRDHLSYTDASFWLQDGIRLAMTLLEKEIRISVWCDRNVDYGELRSILPLVRQNCMTTLTKLGVMENSSFGILCPYSVPGDQCLVSLELQEGNITRYQPRGDRCLSHGGDISKFEYLFQVLTLASFCQGNIKHRLRPLYILPLFH